MFPYPLAVCDIGGTNARFAYARALNEPLIHLSQANTARYPDLASACAGVFASAGVSPASLIACAAGPVINRTVRLTNIHWTIDGPEVAHSLGLTQGLLLNDFEALALTLPALKADSVLMIGTQDPLKSNGQQRKAWHHAGFTHHSHYSRKPLIFNRADGRPRQPQNGA